MINLKEPAEVIQDIKRVLAESGSLTSAIKKFDEGDIILQESQNNDSIFIILEGIVQLSKVHGNDVVELVTLAPGDFLGLLSFYSGEPTYATATAKTPVTVLHFDHTEFEEINTTHPEISPFLQTLIINNLTDRYRRTVYLHLEIATLTQQLQEEKEHLKDTIERLEQTRNRLVHQEKMATLGQLVAGIAHEINNPASALLRSVDNLITLLPTILDNDSNKNKSDKNKSLFKIGLNRTIISTEEQRILMDELSEKYPNLDRSLIRTLSQIGKNNLELIKKELSKANNNNELDELNNLIKFFNIGSLLKSIETSSERISNIVKSLKNYSRQETGQYETVDIRDGIRDTLLMLDNRIKKFLLKLDLPEVPKVNCLVGEINQVWTNIIVNACDAMGDSGVLKISCGIEDDNNIYVIISDTGPGIPNELREKIFQPTFTTKSASGNFGLGLGLAISNDIVQKHGGRIKVSKSPEGGAAFKVILPIAKE